MEDNGVLHQDISAKNIMILVDQDKDVTEEASSWTNDVQGLLVDWDMCKSKNELNGPRTVSNIIFGGLCS